MAPKKLHVKYKSTADNGVLTLMTKILPKSTLYNMSVKMSAPKSRPRDVYETLGEDHCEIIEVEKDKVWFVTHVRGGENPKGFKGIGLNPTQENYDKIMEAAKLLGDKTVQQAEKDWSSLKKYFAIDPKDGENGEYCKAYRQDSIMVVVKLPNGDLMLYNPIPIHEGTKLGEWMKTMGKVKFIVIGSCYHTLFLPETLTRYPDAICIGTKLSEDKLKAANALPKTNLDYNLLEDDEVIAANEALGTTEIKFKFVKGDVLTHSIFLQAYHTGITVDLFYGHHSNSSCDFVTCKGIFEGKDTDPAYFGTRLFDLRLVKKPNSPFGYLPGYRFSGMDPTSAMSKMGCPRPANDGSSCKEMANSLRDILKMDYTNVISIHWGLMSANDFKLSINENWKWLDESTLLPFYKPGFLDN